MEKLMPIITGIIVACFGIAFIVPNMIVKYVLFIFSAILVIVYKYLKDKENQKNTTLLHDILQENKSLKEENINTRNLVEKEFKKNFKQLNDIQKSNHDKLEGLNQKIIENFNKVEKVLSTSNTLQSKTKNELLDTFNQFSNDYNTTSKKYTNEISELIRLENKNINKAINKFVEKPLNNIHLAVKDISNNANQQHKASQDYLNDQFVNLRNSLNENKENATSGINHLIDRLENNNQKYEEIVHQFIIKGLNNVGRNVSYTNEILENQLSKIKVNLEDEIVVNQQKIIAKLAQNHLEIGNEFNQNREMLQPISKDITNIKRNSEEINEKIEDQFTELQGYIEDEIVENQQQVIAKLVQNHLEIGNEFNQNREMLQPISKDITNIKRNSEEINEKIEDQFTELQGYIEDEIVENQNSSLDNEKVIIKKMSDLENQLVSSKEENLSGLKLIKQEVADNKIPEREQALKIQKDIIDKINNI
ncbi:hypothetical protein [Staphylococcus hominis]|uniref:hypothetical protein n=2 Tax=Staphylococcus hominis TaxID=1290 RepID=UPI00103F494E|nr:hypothetical protein [Staphylococcus hominis]MDS3891484.1 hypothetical protein [Staphylococcus hominis]QIY36062.1 hypothetical protein FOC53_00550 [Staphylococcus hominis]TBW88046.1 hypothetical protein EQ804_08685 [Staphylococcus hominis]